MERVSTTDCRTLWVMAAGSLLGLLFICAGSMYSQIRIMPLGDSITRGVLGSTYDIGYRRALYQALVGAGHSVKFVGSQTDGLLTDFDRKHEGHDGWRADQIRDNISGWLTTNPADIILLHIGTNDISRGDSNSSTVSEVNEILNRIDAKSTATVVFLARIINRNDTSAFRVAQTTDYNNLLQTLADTRSANGDLIFVVDQESALSYPADLADRVHPNDAGYVKMAQCWFTALCSYLPSAKANTKVWLEGAFSNDSMRTTLRTAGSIPLTQPYNTAPWSYAGSENVTSIPADVVDWVLIELRTGTAASTKVATRAAFLKSNGSIVDLDGTSTVGFSSRAAGNYYVVIRHRNHLAVMSASTVSLSSSSALYDFTTSQSPAYGTDPMKQVGTRYTMYAGDGNQSGIVTAADADAAYGVINTTGYNVDDVNLSGIVTAADANVVFGNINKATQVP
jgi:lysophospholipase L1-like esterase